MPNFVYKSNKNTHANISQTYNKIYHFSAENPHFYMLLCFNVRYIIISSINKFSIVAPEPHPTRFYCISLCIQSNILLPNDFRRQHFYKIYLMLYKLCAVCWCLESSEWIKIPNGCWFGVRLAERNKNSRVIYERKKMNERWKEIKKNKWEEKACPWIRICILFVQSKFDSLMKT